MNIPKENRRESYDAVLPSVHQRQAAVLYLLENHGPMTAQEVADELRSHGLTTSNERNFAALADNDKNGLFEHDKGAVEKPVSVAIESNNNVTWLALPATAAELNRALMDINALDKDYAIVDCKTTLGSIALEKIAIGGDINEVNYLAARLSELPQVQLDKLEAVTENPESLADLTKMIDFTYNTDYYLLIPDVKNAEDLARYYIFDTEMIDMPREWKDGIDLYAFGTNLEEQEKGVYTAKGYLLQTGDPWKQVFEATRNVPSEYRVDNYLKSAEMSTEQNYNQIDGLMNNSPQPKADLTDGATHDELMELAPETLEKPAAAEKPSILGQLKDAKESVVKPGAAVEKKPPDLDL